MFGNREKMKTFIIIFGSMETIKFISGEQGIKGTCTPWEGLYNFIHVLVPIAKWKKIF